MDLNESNNKVDPQRVTNIVPLRSVCPAPG